jgi:hypothetical protein
VALSRQRRHQKRHSSALHQSKNDDHSYEEIVTVDRPGLRNGAYEPTSAADNDKGAASVLSVVHHNETYEEQLPASIASAASMSAPSGGIHRNATYTPQSATASMSGPIDHVNVAYEAAEPARANDNPKSASVTSPSGGSTVNVVQTSVSPANSAKSSSGTNAAPKSKMALKAGKSAPKSSKSKKARAAKAAADSAKDKAGAEHVYEYDVIPGVVSASASASEDNYAGFYDDAVVIAGPGYAVPTTVSGPLFDAAVVPLSSRR